MELREPIENFEFLDVLHGKDHDELVLLTVWLGIHDWHNVFMATKTKPGPSAIAVVMKLTRKGGLRFGWMPPSHSYWHRASHCPLKETRDDA